MGESSVMYMGIMALPQPTPSPTIHRPTTICVTVGDSACQRAPITNTRAQKKMVGLRPIKSLTDPATRADSRAEREVMDVTRDF